MHGHDAFADRLVAGSTRAGTFVTDLVGDLARAAADPASPDHADAVALQVVLNEHGDRGFFVDTGARLKCAFWHMREQPLTLGFAIAASPYHTAVYTKNRTFRLVGSSKFGRTAVLVPATPPADGWARQSVAWFRRTLVCSVGTHASDLRILSTRARPAGASEESAVPRWQPPRASPDSVHERSPYPAIDAFIADVVRSLPQPGGFVRGVVYFPEGTLLRHVSGRPSGCIQLSGSPPCARGRTCAGKHLLYHVGGCRYCELVERPHKSNHVNYVADLALGIYFQRCMDPDCRRQADRGPVHALPPELNPFRDDVPTPPGGRDGLADDDDWMWAVDVGPEQAGSNGRVARYGVGGGWRRFAARVLMPVGALSLHLNSATGGAPADDAELSTVTTSSDRPFGDDDAWWDSVAAAI